MPISKSWQGFAKNANDRKCTTLNVLVASCPVSPRVRLDTVWMNRSGLWDFCNSLVETNQSYTVQQLVRIFHTNLLHFKESFSEIDWNNHNLSSFLQFSDSRLQRRLLVCRGRLTFIRVCRQWSRSEKAAYRKERKMTRTKCDAFGRRE